MKHRFLTYSFIFLFIIMLAFPKLVLQGSSSGLLLWFETVLPTLLPFIILCNLLLSTSAFSLISRITSPLLCRIFGVSRSGSFAVLVGFLCGYPMGAKVTADLLEQDQISRTEAMYLLSFCNNSSPIFIISYVLIQHLHQTAFSIWFLLILFVPPVLCSFFFRRFYHMNLHTHSTRPVALKKAFSAHVIDESIMNGFETITKIGGYIMLFSILLALAKQLPIQHPLFVQMILPSLEITNGIHLLCTQNPLTSQAFIFVMALTSFGGWCSVAQTYAMICKSGLPILPYIKQKLITAVVTSLLAYIMLFLL